MPRFKPFNYTVIVKYVFAQRQSNVIHFNEFLEAYTATSHAFLLTLVLYLPVLLYCDYRAHLL